MAFTFPKNPTYVWPVTFHLPEDGEHVEYKVELIFNRLSPEQISKLTDKTIGKYNKFIRDKDSDIKPPTSEEIRETKYEFLKKVVNGWKNVNDEEGNEYKFTPERFVDFLNLSPKIDDQVLSAYTNSQVPSAEKN